MTPPNNKNASKPPSLKAGERPTQKRAKSVSKKATPATRTKTTNGKASPSKHSGGHQSNGQQERGILARSLRFTVYWGAVIAVWGAIAGTLIFFYLAHDLPNLDALPSPGESDRSVVIKAANGTTVSRSGPIHGDWIPFTEIPDAMVRALLAVEDRSFFSHLGVDGKGLARAALINLQSGRVRAGGSTITQQLAKNLFLENKRSLTRKTQELLLAFWLERKFSKEDILTLYLNRVYFGGGAYGIDAASQTFFGHSARTLSVPEAALLAGLVQAPSRLAPHINPDGAWARANTVLQAMADVGALTQKAADTLKGQRPRLLGRGLGPASGYFADWIEAELNTLLEGASQQSLIVYTTMDPASQRAAYDSVRRNMGLEGDTSKPVPYQGALVALDHDGAVRAMIGGKDYGQSQYNRAAQAKRQPGSAYKLFVYLTALERGFALDDTVTDSPIQIDGWSPRNYSGTYSGEMSVAEAFARSINTVAVILTEQIGRESVIAMAHRLGVKSFEQPIPSLPLGTEEMTLLELAGAYASVASGGFRAEPYGIIEVTTLGGEILYRRPPKQPVPVLARPVVDDAVTLLAGVIENGSGRRARLDRPAGGKTGTTQDNRDALFAGFTSDLTAVVWVGNDDASPMTGVTGSGLPATIWADFMINAHAGAPVRPLLADTGLLTDWATAPSTAVPTPTKPEDIKKKKKKSIFERIFGSR